MSAARWSLGEFGIRVRTQDYLKIHEQEAVRKAGLHSLGGDFGGRHATRVARIGGNMGVVDVVR